MKPRPLQRSKLSTAIAAQLRDSVLDGELLPGAQLPGHRELARVFGVSVPSVREAISALTTAGILETRAGSGTYVTQSPQIESALSTWTTQPSDEVEMRDLVEARDVIERAVARFAAQRATSSEIRLLRTAVMEMRRTIGDADRYLAADLTFHQTLAVAAHNQVLARAVLAFRSSYKREHQFHAERTTTREADVIVGTTLHERLVDAVARKDPAQAEHVMDELIARARSYLPDPPQRARR